MRFVNENLFGGGNVSIKRGASSSLICQTQTLFGIDQEAGGMHEKVLPFFVQLIRFVFLGELWRPEYGRTQVRHVSFGCEHMASCCAQHSNIDLPRIWPVRASLGLVPRRLRNRPGLCPPLYFEDQSGNQTRFSCTRHPQKGQST